MQSLQSGSILIDNADGEMKPDLSEQTYEWHFLTRYPPSYLNNPRLIEMFRQWVKVTADAEADFEMKLRRTAMSAIKVDDPKLIRQSLQCLAHVGSLDDLSELAVLEGHADPFVRRDVNTCIFEIRHRSGQAGPPKRLE